MPMLTVIAPGSRVAVEGMVLPNATVERVELRAGVNPVLYHLTWRQTATDPLRRCTFRADQVVELETRAAAPIPGRGRLADLGKQFTDPADQE